METAAGRGREPAEPVVAISPDGKLLAIGTDHGSVRLLPLTTPVKDISTDLTELALRAVATNSGLVRATSGHFDVAGLEAGRATIVCRMGSMSFPIEPCEERLCAKGLMARALRGDASHVEP